MRSRTNQFYFAILVLISLCALRVSAQGRSTVDDYANRLDRAEQRVKEVIERKNKASELATKMNEVKRLLPVSEEVEFIGATTRVDNAWLHEAVDSAVKTEGDGERRLQMLREISARLVRLRQSVNRVKLRRAGRLRISAPGSTTFSPALNTSPRKSANRR